MDGERLIIPTPAGPRIAHCDCDKKGEDFKHKTHAWVSCIGCIGAFVDGGCLGKFHISCGPIGERTYTEEHKSDECEICKKFFWVYIEADMDKL